MKEREGDGKEYVLVRDVGVDAAFTCEADTFTPKLIVGYRKRYSRRCVEVPEMGVSTKGKMVSG
jgi:hypothetical protein